MTNYQIKMTPTANYHNGATVYWTETRMNFFGETETVRHGRWFEHLLSATAWRDERIAADGGADVGIA